MDLKMLPVTFDDCLAITDWRIDARATLRTSEMATLEQQKKWFEALQDAAALHRYFSFTSSMSTLCAVGGLTNIHWTNRNAEISLIVNPKMQRKGIGTQCVDMLLNEAFKKMGLKTCYGETYMVNVPGLEFWKKIIVRHSSRTAILPNRKFWDGAFHNSLYFSIDEGDYDRTTNSPI